MSATIYISEGVLQYTAGPASHQVPPLPSPHLPRDLTLPALTSHT